jgi:hypothetical protein
LTLLYEWNDIGTAGQELLKSDDDGRLDRFRLTVPDGAGDMALSETPLLISTAFTLDPSSGGLEYDGHGGLSAGASSRLLADYKEGPRSEILDYLCASHVKHSNVTHMLFSAQ